MSAADFIS